MVLLKVILLAALLVAYECSSEVISSHNTQYVPVDKAHGLLAGDGCISTKTTQVTAYVLERDEGGGYLVNGNTLKVDCLEWVPVVVPAGKTVALSWTAPAFRENGDHLAAGEIENYRVFYRKGEIGDGYEPLILVETVTGTEYKAELGAGHYYFAVSAVDVNGLESNQALAELSIKGEN